MASETDFRQSEAWVESQLTLIRRYHLMLRHVRRIAQVTLLTAVLVFSTLLVVGSFNTPSWSDGHHTEESYWGVSIGDWSIHFGSEEYESGSHHD